MNLRPKIFATPIFINFINEKCSIRYVRINTFGNMGKEIVKYLNLPDPNLYSEHCFRRTSMTILVHAGDHITSLKRHS